MRNNEHLKIKVRKWLLKMSESVEKWDITSWQWRRWWEISAVPVLPSGAIECTSHLLISRNKSGKSYKESNITSTICPTKIADTFQSYLLWRACFKLQDPKKKHCFEFLNVSTHSRCQNLVGSFCLHSIFRKEVEGKGLKKPVMESISLIPAHCT